MGIKSSISKGKTLGLAAVILAGVSFIAAPAAQAASFDEQWQKVSASPGTQSESAILGILDAGIKEGKPAQAVWVAQQWLRQNLPQNPQVLYYSARAAELTADLKGAASLYQQYLEKADPASADANDAAFAIHVILIERLNDPASAYAFMRNAGTQLSGIKSVRQFDKWYLDMAFSRDDKKAVADRLATVVTAGVPQDVFTVHYHPYFPRLIKSIATNIEQPGNTFRGDDHEAVLALASKINFDDEIKLRLAFESAVRNYNLKRVAEEEIDAPVAEATALLNKYPHYAARVMDGWGGGSNSHHYRNNATKYLPHQIGAKLKPIKQALTKLDDAQKQAVYARWKSGYYGNKVNVLDKPEFDALAKQDPSFLNHKLSRLVSFTHWHGMKKEEAEATANLLEKNPNHDAAFVRVLGASFGNYDRAIELLHSTEAWRLDAGLLDGRNTDRLWHIMGRPGGNGKRDQAIKRSKDLANKIRNAVPKAKAPANQRIAAFQKLFNEYKSGKYVTPGLRWQLVETVKVTPEAVAHLIKDGGPDAVYVLTTVLPKGFDTAKGPLSGEERARGVSVSSYYPRIMRNFDLHRGNRQYVKDRTPDAYRAYPIEPELRTAVAAQMKSGKVDRWLAYAWLNSQHVELSDESKAFAKQFGDSPAFNKLPYDVRTGARKSFTTSIMSDGEAAVLRAGNPNHFSKTLKALTAKSEAPEVAAALTEVIKGLEQAPFRVMPQGMRELGAVKTAGVFTDEAVFDQLITLSDPLRVMIDGHANRDIAWALLNAVAAKKDPVIYHRTALTLWKWTTVAHSPRDRMLELSQELIESSPSAASAFARAGLLVMSQHSRGHTWFKRESDIPLLKSVLGRSATAMGMVVIPVAKTDVTYPIYKSQADWLVGNDEASWTQLDENWEQLLPIHQELSVPYLMWALQRTVYSRNEVRQQDLVSALRSWANEQNTPMSLAERVNLELAYGDIAIQRGMLKQAHEIFSRAATSPAFESSPARFQAVLGKAKVQRLAKNFDGALETLEELAFERIPELWAPVRYAKSEVLYDQEEYEDAAEVIQALLAYDPNHPDAIIMRGNLDLKREKLMEATEVELGSSSAQKNLVPGEQLKVTLIDPTLAVSGAGTEIEVVVWATSGDKEQFFLRQFGDQKTKFRGEVDTELGAPVLGDRKLQVVGDDEIWYAYTDRFVNKMPGLDAKKGGPITVASDGLLIASARRLLTAEEQRIKDMEKEMASLRIREEERGSTKAKLQYKMQLAANSSNLLGANKKGGQDNAFQKRKKREEGETDIGDLVKPGQKIYIRVVDPDSSRTPEVDELSVSVNSSSGDSVSRIILKETDTHSGWFEGTLETTGAQATATGTEAEPGRNPNMVISPRTDYPAWRPVVQKNKKPYFSIDLNDNVEIGEMVITAKEAGSKLKKFTVQTGMNMKDINTIGGFPHNMVSTPKPWHPSVIVMSAEDSSRGYADLNKDWGRMTAFFREGWVNAKHMQGTSKNVVGPSDALPASIPTDVKWTRSNRHDNSHVISRFRAYFYEDAEVTRKFKWELGKHTIPPKTHGSLKTPPKFMLTVNGRPIGTPESKGLEGEIRLRKGIHSVELWAVGWATTTVGFGRDTKLLSNHGNPEVLSQVQDSLFDPANFPEGSTSHRNGLATVEASESGDEFKVTFSPGSRARIITLMLSEYEGSAPALNRVTLNTPNKKPVLPVQYDYAELQKNDTLEILTGDKINVQYVDDRFVTKTKERQERSLKVSFYDANVHFSFMEMREAWNGKLVPFFEELLRFEYGKPVDLWIKDPDMDETKGQDSVEVLIASKTGGKKKFMAKERKDVPGLFHLQVVPVQGEPVAANEIKVAPGGTLIAAYKDQDNVRPGVPFIRYARVLNAVYAEPELRVSHATVGDFDMTSLPAEMRIPMPSFRPGFKNLSREQVAALSESARKAYANAQGRLMPRWTIDTKKYSGSNPPEGGTANVLGSMMDMEVVAPHLVLRTGSTVDVFVQTESARKAVGAPAGTFDIDVPGTMRLKGNLSGDDRDRGRFITTIPLYIEKWRTSEELRNTRYSKKPDGALPDRFKVKVPLILGVRPPHGVLTEAQIEEGTYERQHALVVSPNDTIHIGFRYTNPAGQTTWSTTTSKVITHPVMDIMDETYRQNVETAFVGQTVHMRVVDLGADITDGPDTVSVLMQAKSGAKHYVTLRETEAHTGVFQGALWLTHVDSVPQSSDTNGLPFDVMRDGFPVVYGDVYAARYKAQNGISSPVYQVTVSKGADGLVKPFSKQYDDPEIAMRVQFSLAESYLELAKRHRKFGEADTAEHEYGRARDLLAKAMDQFKDPMTRAQAEYLLGNLALEEANDTSEDEADMKDARYRAALSRFMTVTGTYPDTVAASKAQFKIATIYEKLKEPDIAAQEYVKLAYKYPDSEHLATAMARLGTYFLKKAAGYEQKATAFLAKEDDDDAQYEGRAVQMMSIKEYLKSADIFGRLQKRFPDHELAGPAGLRSGQAYMRGKRISDALNAFMSVVNNESYDGKTIRSQAMYWAGMCHEESRNPMAAYSMYKKLTYDFPESKWASYARAQLSQESLLNLETNLEIQRVEEGR